MNTKTTKPLLILAVTALLASCGGSAPSIASSGPQASSDATSTTQQSSAAGTSAENSSESQGTSAVATSSEQGTSSQQGALSF